MKMKLSLLAASAILAVGMTGCWTESAYSGDQLAYHAKAIDGYLAGATGCFDVIEDGKCDNKDISITTRADGSYDVMESQRGYQVILSGGTDLDTGNAFKGVLKAPKGSKVASPLTTLLAEGMNIEDINKLLGTGTTLTLANVTSDFRGTSYNADVAKAAATVQALIGSLVASVQKTSTNTSLTLSQIMTQVVNAIQATPGLVLTDATTIDAQLANVVTALNSNTTLDVSITSATMATDLKNTIDAVKDLDFTNDGKAMEATAKVEEKITNNANNTPLSKAVTIAGNTFTVGGTSTSFTQAGAFTPVTVSSASNVTIDFTLENNGGELSTTPKTMDLAILVDDVNSGRELKGVLKGVQVTVNGTTSTITVPANAVLYVEGKKSTGVGVTTELTDMAQDVFTSNNGVTSVNLTNIMNRIGAKDPASFATITKEGTYNISFFIGGNVTLGFDGASVKVLTAPIETLTVTTTPSHTESVTGTKFTATLTVTK